MKKYRNYLITFLAGAIFATAGSVFAEDGLTKIEAYLRTSLNITLNSNPVTLESPALTYDGNTYLKLRDVAKLTGVNVNWNEQTQTVEMATYGSVTGGTYGTNPVPPVQPIPNPPSTVVTPPITPTDGRIIKNLKFGETLESEGFLITFSSLRVEPATEREDIYNGYDKNVYYTVTLEKKDPSIVNKNIKIQGGLLDNSGKLITPNINAYVNDFLSSKDSFTQAIHIKLSKNDSMPNSIEIKTFGSNIEKATWTAN